MADFTAATAADIMAGGMEAAITAAVTMAMAAMDRGADFDMKEYGA
jgi:hypothetical protein